MLSYSLDDEGIEKVAWNFKKKSKIKAPFVIMIRMELLFIILCMRNPIWFQTTI